VRWTSPENYVSYQLRYSFDKIAWQDIGSDIRVREYLWRVPLVGQSRRCWIKVIGFDANRRKKGTDTQLVYIRVRQPVSVNISYSTNGGETWRLITQIPYANQYTWEDMGINSQRCRFGAQVKVVMKDGNGKTVGSAVGTKFTVISDQPPRLAGYWDGYYCCSPEGMSIPVSGTIDSENGYNFIGELPFGKAKFRGRFDGSCLDAYDDGTLAITGKGTATAPQGHPWSNGEMTAAIALNAKTNAAMTAIQGSWAMNGSGSGDFHIDRE